MFYGRLYTLSEDADSVVLTLEASGAGHPGMVRVSEGSLRVDLFGFDHVKPIDSPPYWIDRFEVTNGEYKSFVDRGGYRTREHWRHEFRDGERTLDWAESMGRFRDQTGRPGPSAWEAGTYAEGTDRNPVSGVSWYEAAAYCESLGKALPTVFHWSGAAWPFLGDSVTPVSNFGDRGLRAIGEGPPGPNGAHDMAGNVKEWCWNEAGGLRYILGGAWNEPTYMFYEHDAQSPWDRLDTYGFRCALYPDVVAEKLALLRAPVAPTEPPTEAVPVSDDVFEAYKALFEFDPVPLDSRVLSVDESNSLWRREKVSFRAPYADEDVIAYLFLPRSTPPPFQTVLYFPGVSAQRQRSPEELQTRLIDFLVTSGRAVMYPIYKGTHERRVDELPEVGSRSEVEFLTYQMNDLRRSVDYLETRGDIQKDKLGYYGLSWGAGLGPIAVALEPRFSASVFLDGGLYPSGSRSEVQAFNYAPRVRIPVLMVNGSFDSGIPLESSQKPLFELLGTPREHKQHVLYPAGHAVFVRFRNQAIENILDWVDRYLGPVS